MKKAAPKKTVKKTVKAVKKSVTKVAVKPAKQSSFFQIILWLSIIFSSILIIISKL